VQTIKGDRNTEIGVVWGFLVSDGDQRVVIVDVRRGKVCYLQFPCLCLCSIRLLRFASYYFAPTQGEGCSVL